MPNGGFDSLIANKRLLAQNLLGISVCVTYLLVVIAGIGRFATSDDASMILIASGRFGAEYRTDQVFTSPPLGWLLAQLYSVSTAVPWWGLMQAIGLSVAVVLLVSALRRDASRFWLGFLIVTFIAGAAVLMLMKMNFTQPAIFCTAVGLGTATWTRSKALTALGLALTIFGVAWRQEGAYIAISLVSLAWLSIVILNWRWQLPIRWKRGLGSVTFGVLAVIVVAWIPRHLQIRADPALREYREFQSAFAQLDGMGNYLYSEVASIEAANAGLSRSDWSLVFHWLLSDSRVFGVKALQSISDSRPIVPEIRAIPRLTGEFAESLLRFPLWLMALAGIGLMALYVVGNRHESLRLIFVLGSGVVVMYGVFLYGRLPERVGLPTILATLAVMFIVIAASHPPEVTDEMAEVESAGSPIRLVLASLMCCVPAIYVIEEQLTSPRAPASAFADVNRCTQSDLPVALSTSYLGPELLKLPINYDPLRDVPNGPILFLDWWQRSPGFERYRESVGLNREVLPAVIHGESWLLTRSPEVPGLLVEFAQEHGHTKSVGLKRVDCPESDTIAVRGLLQDWS